MNITKNYITCKICKKEINVTNGASNFNRHLSTHYNPIGKNCTQWYKKYFKRGLGVCVCVLCGEEFYHDDYYGFVDNQYSKHLQEVHNINQSN